MNIKDVDPCNKAYPEWLLNTYSDRVKAGVKTTEELISVCNNKYGLTPVTVDELDDIARSHLKCFDEIFNNPDKIGNKRNYKLFLLHNNNATKLFYDDYYNCYKDYYLLTKRVCKIFLFFETESGKYASCSSRFESILSILKGIDQKDIDEKTIEYFHYLGNFYSYDCFKEGI